MMVPIAPRIRPNTARIIATIMQGEITRLRVPGCVCRRGWYGEHASISAQLLARKLLYGHGIGNNDFEEFNKWNRVGMNSYHALRGVRPSKN